MSHETSRGTKPQTDVQRAIEHISDYLFEQQESNPGTRYDGERRLSCFEQIGVIKDWVTEHEQQGCNTDTIQTEDNA